MKWKNAFLLACACSTMWASTTLKSAQDCPQPSELQQYAFTLAPIKNMDQNALVTSFVHLAKSQDWVMATLVNAHGLDIAGILKEANHTLQSINSPATLRTFDGHQACVFFANNSFLVAMPMPE